MSSYVLFTLDKLVQKVVKQVQLVLQEEQSHRLVELWRSEAARGVPVSTKAQGCALLRGAVPADRPFASPLLAVRYAYVCCHMPQAVPRAGPPIKVNHWGLCNPRMCCRWWTLCTTPMRMCCCRATPAFAGSACPTAS